VIDVLAQEYSVTMACEVLGCTRSNYYYQAAESPDEAKLKAAIKGEAAKWPTYGYRRITAQLRRQEWPVNHKRVQRLMRLMDLQAKVKRRKRRTTNSKHDFPRYPNLVEDLEVVWPEQVWVSDITYIRLRCNFVYLAVIMDVFTRSIRGWHLARSLDHILTLTALQRALVKHPPPGIHHSDQGVQYAATAYTQVLQDVNVQISMADVGQAWQNGYAERLIRTIKEDEVDLSEYLDYHDACRQIGRFLDDVYIHKRIHSSLGYLTPAEFEAKWRKEHTLVLECELKIA
jgi:transposase InsO family protein